MKKLTPKMFVDTETKRLKWDRVKMLSEVEEVLVDLMEYPNDNKHQIKFYRSVKKYLENNLEL